MGGIKAFLFSQGVQVQHGFIGKPPGAFFFGRASSRCFGHSYLCSDTRHIAEKYHRRQQRARGTRDVFCTRFQKNHVRESGRNLRTNCKKYLAESLSFPFCCVLLYKKEKRPPLSCQYTHQRRSPSSASHKRQFFSSCKVAFAQAAATLRKYRATRSTTSGVGSICCCLSLAIMSALRISKGATISSFL